MPTIPYNAPIKCLVAVRGHPFDRNAFDKMFEGMDGVAGIMVDQPAAAQLINPDAMAPYDALVLYDMPGLDFTIGRGAPAFVDPPPFLKEGFRALLASGKGVVALHHSIAGWPTWNDYGEWLGGRFLYKPAQVQGMARLDSGYAHNIEQTFKVVADHPVMTDLPSTFILNDEPYLFEIFESDITPLLRSSASFNRQKFYSASAAVAGRLYDNEGWDHPPGSDVAAWSKRALNSPLVYIQPGDVATTFENPRYRRLVENAIRYVVSAGRRY